MGQAIFKVDDNGEERFLVWSSNVDAPITFARAAEEIVAMFGEDAKQQAIVEAEQMIERARLTGSSSRMGYNTLADVVTANHAGPGGSILTEDEIIEFYVRRKKDPTAAALAAYRKNRK